MKFLMWSAVLLVLLALRVPSGLAEQDAVPSGKSIFAKKCSICHGKEGEGKATIARLYKVELQHLSSKEVQTATDADLKKIITKGKGKMRAVTLKSNEVDDVVAFLRSIAKK